jgi:GH24 family phage-related lysozyme (muramidase)
MDWQRHPHAARLQSAAGLTGPMAREALRRFADIAVEYGLAREVFDQTSLVEHYRIARRVFKPAQFDAAPGLVKGALTSLVFNRGGSMAGPGRVEFRVIRDTCLAAPATSGACVATQIRAMKRLWRGSTIERGMDRRREAEAVLAEAV